MPLNPMGYELFLGQPKNTCKDVNRLNVQKSCAEPRVRAAFLVPARPAQGTAALLWFKKHLLDPEFLLPVLGFGMQVSKDVQIKPDNSLY